MFIQPIIRNLLKKETSLRDFPVILKHLLQNYSKKCLLVTICIVIWLARSNLQPHTGVCDLVASVVDREVANKTM